MLYSPPVQLPYMSVLGDRQQAEKKKAQKNFSDVAFQWREFLLGLQGIELQPRSLYPYSYIGICVCISISSYAGIYDLNFNHPIANWNRVS